MGVADCESCEACGVTLEEHPADHRTPAPHDCQDGICLKCMGEKVCEAGLKG